jgi:hypothetical protein
MPIGSYVEDCAIFEPEVITAMSQALEETCVQLQIRADQNRDREMIAIRIIDLARNGVVDTKALRDRVLLEAASAT